jgi:hypothetical protein
MNPYFLQQSPRQCLSAEITQAEPKRIVDACTQNKHIEASRLLISLQIEGDYSPGQTDINDCVERVLFMLQATDRL